MTLFRIENSKLIWTRTKETLWIEPWGKDTIRVRSTVLSVMPDLSWALLDPMESQRDKYNPASVRFDIQDDHASMVNGLVKIVITSDGRITFFKTTDNSILLREPKFHFAKPANRSFKHAGGDLFRTEARFESNDNERFYGLGQHQHGLLDQKGCVIELKQRNTEVSIPWLISNRMYGFLWNNPGIGRVELANNGTAWINDGTRLVDYLVTCGNTYFDLMERYADLTGYPPMIPEFATGFWQCKLRYETPEQVLKVAREYKKRKLPLSVIVIDFMHWTKMGEWKFDPSVWPDPEGLVKELKSLGVETMVSIWPTVNRNSENYREMFQKGYLLQTERGMNILHCMPDNPGLINQYHHYYDPTHPDARRFIWDKVKDGYLKKGIRVFWLDACEPETYPPDFDNIRYHIGNGLEVGCIYPFMHQMAFHDGLKESGESGIITLNRSAWAGSQRFGAAVWSGDIDSTFETLKIQVRAGLNMAMSGIPWWNTDIGGFLGGDINSPFFRNLIVKWFQYGVFCPIFRLHGDRLPAGHHTGADNEVWSFGDEAYESIKECLFLREKLRPYIMEQMKLAHLKGTPMMRPLFFDFPNDKTCYEIDDQFMFGPDIMVAPILEENSSEREVYLPGDVKWKNEYSGEITKGGNTIKIDSNVNSIHFSRIK